MNPAEFREVRAAFEVVLDLEPVERERELERRFQGREELLAAAQDMLRGFESSATFLEPPSNTRVGAIRTAGARILQAGQRIGDFELVDPVASGGMGEVWRARQKNPSRTVAFKTVRSGSLTERARRRFEDESEILGQLDHAGIARVYASGVLEEGEESRPWFAMEWIEDAVTITVAGQERKVRGKLMLVREACLAVHHGHLRGVVHRDLKPDNLLVDRDGHVRVIDYGIARHLDSGSSLTGAGEWIGTLRYMAPEQVRGQGKEVDVRTDVHALGVVLVELLTCASPWKNDEAGWDLLAREIRDDDPLLPSRLDPRLSAELDWICARAMAKRPQERYASARDLADDLERFLDQQPLVAGPPTLGYRTRKFLRRNRSWVLTATVGVSLLVAGLGGTGFGLLRSLERGQQLERARIAAEDGAAHARAMNEFLNGVLRSPDPFGQDQGSVADMLDRASRQVDRAFADRPGLAADTRTVLGTSYHGRGRYKAALEQFDRARELYELEQPGRGLKRLRCERLRAVTIGQLGQLEQCVSLLRSVVERVEVFEPTDSTELASACSDLAWALQASGELEQSLEFSERAIASLDGETESTAVLLAVAHGNRAVALRALGTAEQVEAAYREAWRLNRRASGERSLNAAIAGGNLGAWLYRVGDYGGARELFQQVLEVQRELLPRDHPVLASTLYNLASALEGCGQLDEAERVSLELVALQERVHGKDHPATAEARSGLAYLANARGEFARAARGHGEYAEFLERSEGPGSLGAQQARAREAQALDRELLGRGEQPRHFAPLCRTLLEQEGPDHTVVNYLRQLAEVGFQGAPERLGELRELLGVPEQP